MEFRFLQTAHIWARNGGAVLAALGLALLSLAIGAAAALVTLPANQFLAAEVLKVLAWTTGVAGVAMLGATVGLEKLRYDAQERYQLIEEWKRSYREFRDNATAVCAHVRSALIMQSRLGQDPPTNKDWQGLAIKARYPRGLVMALPAKRPGFLETESAKLDTNYELPLLTIAQHVVAVELNTVRFITARSHATDALSQWVLWRNEKAIRHEIAKRLCEHREVIVMLAFLEAAQAARIGRSGDPDPWTEILEHFAWLENPVFGQPR